MVDRFLSEKNFIENSAIILGLTNNDLRVIFDLYSYVTHQETGYIPTFPTKKSAILVKYYSILGLQPTASKLDVTTA